MTDFEKGCYELGYELGKVCRHLVITFGKWIRENQEIMSKLFPILTNNGKKRLGLPMYRRQAIRKAKKNRKKGVVLVDTLHRRRRVD